MPHAAIPEALPAAVDLFGTIPCTFAEVALWCLAVAGIAPSSPRFTHYARGWRVVEKVREAKATGHFEDILSRGLQNHALTLPDALALAEALAPMLGGLDVVKALMRPIHIAPQIAQFHPQPAPRDEARTGPGEHGHEQGIHAGLLALGGGDGRARKQRAKTIAQEVIRGRKERLRNLRERRNARMGGGFGQSGDDGLHGDPLLVEKGLQKSSRRASETRIPRSPLSERLGASILIRGGDADLLAGGLNETIKRPADRIRNSTPYGLSRAGEPSLAHHKSNAGQNHERQHERPPDNQVFVEVHHVYVLTTPSGPVA